MIREFMRGLFLVSPLTSFLGNGSLRCSTSRILAVVSRKGRGRISVAARPLMRKLSCC